MSQTLQQTIDDMVIPGQGILAADESIGTIGKRFDTINIENNEENRSRYRALLATTPNLGDYISGVILFEETLTQQTDDNRSIVQAFVEQKIVPGIKVDKGLIPFVTNPSEKITQGLDGLGDRLVAYKKQGARFAKWRDVYTISNATPSYALIKANAELLARYAAVCQANDIVPIVEPEVLMDGDHNILRNAEVSEFVLQEVFHALYIHQVSLEHMILKPNMVIPAKQCSNQSNAEQIAELTVRTLKRTVPSAVPSINFLSGGQSPEEATVNLQAINAIGNLPWYVSFSYGRALQEPCLKTWQGDPEQLNQSQAALLKRAKLNGAAAVGKYTPDMEKA